MRMKCKINKRNKLQKREIKIKVQGVQVIKRGGARNKKKRQIGSRKSQKRNRPERVDLGR